MHLDVDTDVHTGLYQCLTCVYTCVCTQGIQHVFWLRCAGTTFKVCIDPCVGKFMDMFIEDRCSHSRRQMERHATNLVDAHFIPASKAVLIRAL